MKQYKKKPVVIEAIQFVDDAERILEIQEFMGGGLLRVNYEDPKNPFIRIETLEGEMKAMEGDYIIKGVNGEFYPCKPDIFEKTYDEVDETCVGMSFGDAIEVLKQGGLVRRAGWNGKGMFLFIRPSDSLPVDFIVDKVKSLPASFKSWVSDNCETNDNIKFAEYICMKAADGSITNGWNATQVDMLAEDWEIVG